MQCVSGSALTMEASGQGVTDLSPLTPSAGQTLTLGQMDNRLCALSPPDHTLLLTGLTIASPFTSCCPSSLLPRPPCPALICLNLQIHSCLQSTFCLFQHDSFFFNIRPLFYSHILNFLINFTFTQVSYLLSFISSRFLHPDKWISENMTNTSISFYCKSSLLLLIF